MADFSFFVLTLLALSFVLAATVSATTGNDWSTPCLNGTCQYSLTPDAQAGSGSGLLKIWGSADAISDITPAAGWMIMDCTTNASAQSIRLVCMGDNSTCEHLYSNTGPTGKLVRLPESCGRSAFARVAKAWIPEDQSIPGSNGSLAIRSDGSTAQVRALALDTDFSAIDPSSAGAVHFSIQGVNAGGTPSSGTGSMKRSSSSGSISAVSGRSSLLSLDDGSFDIDNTTELAPINFDQTANVFNATIACPIDASVSVDVDGKANIQMSVGLNTSGTIVPPNIDSFQILTDMNATLDGTISLDIGLGGTFDSGLIPILQQGIPGLSFTDVFSIGPILELNAQVTSSLNVNLNTTVGVNWGAENAQIVFPPPTGVNETDQSQNAFQLQDTPLNLSVSPSIDADGSITAHLIPSLNFGVSAFDNVVSATIFINLDASATLELTGNASTQFNSTSSNTTSISSNSTSTSANSTATSTSPNATWSSTSSSYISSSPSSSNAYSSAYYPMQQRAPKPTSIVEAVYRAKLARASSKNIRSDNSTDSGSANNTGSSNSTDSSPASGADSSNSNSSLSLGGCVEVDAGFSVNVGVDGNFSQVLTDLFGGTTQTTLFSKEFTLFQKCFGSDSSGANTTSRRALPLSPRAEAGGGSGTSSAVSALQCLAGDILPSQPIISDLISAAGAVASTKKPGR